MAPTRNLCAMSAPYPALRWSQAAVSQAFLGFWGMPAVQTQPKTKLVPTCPRVPVSPWWAWRAPRAGTTVGTIKRGAQRLSRMFKGLGEGSGGSKVFLAWA